MDGYDLSYSTLDYLAVCQYLFCAIIATFILKDLAVSVFCVNTHTHTHTHTSQTYI